MSQFNFEESILVGIERANIATNNKKEIEEIFQEFSDSFRRISNGEIYTEVKQQTRTYFPNSSAFLSATLAIAGNIKSEQYVALVITNGSKSIDIAEVIYNDNGYPIRLKIKDDTSAYSDGESLTLGLSDLAAKTHVGKAYNSLRSQ